MLVEYFVKRYAEKAGKQIRKIDRNTLERVSSRILGREISVSWQNIVERSVILSSGEHFLDRKGLAGQPGGNSARVPSPLPDTLQNQERKND